MNLLNQISELVNTLGAAVDQVIKDLPADRAALDKGVKFFEEEQNLNALLTIRDRGPAGDGTEQKVEHASALFALQYLALTWKLDVIDNIVGTTGAPAAESQVASQNSV